MAEPPITSEEKPLENPLQSILNSEVDLEDLSSTLLEKAQKKFAKEKTLSSLAYLKQTEELLEMMATKGKPAKVEYVIVTLNNISACYQRLGDMEKCASYLEACAFNCSKVNIQKSLEDVADDIKKTKLHAKLLIQLCVTLSNMKKHKEALEKAKLANNLTKHALQATFDGFKAMVSKFKNKKYIQSLDLQLITVFQAIAASAQEILKAISIYLNSGEIPKPESLEMRSVLGVITFSNWVGEFGISDIMVIQPLSLEEILEKPLLQAEFTKDYLLYKIALHSVSLFCVATEMKHLKSSQQLSADQRRQAEVTHQTAISLLKAFFPNDCPLLQHVIQSFQRRLLSELQEIPEEEDKQNPKKSRRAQSGDFRKLPTLREKRVKVDLIRNSPYNNKFERLLPNRPRSSLGNRKHRENQNPASYTVKKKNIRNSSLDFNKRSKTPHEMNFLRSWEDSIIESAHGDQMLS
ncbi:unnamed protein product [Blepharisma stoltei]|uniref:Uncharacterized protein n=1 Tax=Blepharisma stoltei TaxID=1481888 RepID=A0AAU9JWK7_9CILI|nr:unnamed protein product [Blepharisma stoltei]